MVKLSTTVAVGRAAKPLSLKDEIVLLGSCFVDNVAEKLKNAGFQITANPFGTIYNPASIAQAVELLDSQRLFTKADCVKMGAGVEKICSFYHHSSFARKEEQEFLENANKELERARGIWHKANKVIVSLGTAMVWEHKEEEGKRLVNNCLKRPGYEFEHRMLSLEEVNKSLKSIVEAHPEKDFIFTVSPIRHMGEGAQLNTLSKSRLHLAIEDLGLDYFPAYEILLDELRDYRYFSEDLVHPSKVAIEIIWERFLDYASVPEEKKLIEQNEKSSKFTQHARRD